MKCNKTKLTVLVLACALFAALAGCSGTSSTFDGPSPFQNMETVDLDGNAVDSSAFSENTLTMVNAWNLGCAACIDEIPALDQLNDEMADKGVAVMGLYYNFGEELSETDRAEIADVLSKSGAKYPHLLASDDMMKTDALKEMAAFPMTFFVDSEGNIVDAVAGSNDFEGWKKTIENTLEKVETNA